MTINKYAIIEIGSKQFMVCEGEVVSIYKNESITTFNTLFFKDGDTLFVGAPFVEKGGVLLTYTGDKQVKSSVRRFKGKSRYRVDKSHSDLFANYTVSKIDLGIQNKIELKPNKDKIDEKKQEKTSTKVAVKKVKKTPKKITKKVKEVGITKKRGAK